jgi:hypothetical protein
MVQGYHRPLGKYSPLYLGVEGFSVGFIERLARQPEQTIHLPIPKARRIGALRYHLIPLKENQEVLRLREVGDPAGLPEGKRCFLEAFAQGRPQKVLYPQAKPFPGETAL